MNKIKSERVGLDSNKLKSMDLFFKDKYLNTGKLAGIQTLISRKGKIVHFNSIGKSDVEKS